MQNNEKIMKLMLITVCNINFQEGLKYRYFLLKITLVLWTRLPSLNHVTVIQSSDFPVKSQMFIIFTKFGFVSITSFPLSFPWAKSPRGPLSRRFPGIFLRNTFITSMSRPSVNIASDSTAVSKKQQLQYRRH